MKLNMMVDASQVSFERDTSNIFTCVCAESDETKETDRLLLGF